MKPLPHTLRRLLHSLTPRVETSASSPIPSVVRIQTVQGIDVSKISPDDGISPDKLKGTGFSPYIRAAKSTRALAPEGRFPSSSTFVTKGHRNLLWLLLPVAFLAACSRFHHETHEYVYVSARQVYLHDRVAAVSNRVGLVTNGEALEVIERGKRFVKVRTPKGEIGWLEDHAIIDDKLYAQFEDLGKKHSGDPVVANAQLRDDLYLHVAPGRDTPHFLVVPGNAKVQLLARGTIEKSQGPGMLPSLKPKPPKSATGAAPSKTDTLAIPNTKASPAPAKTNPPDPASPAPIPPPVPMEDWWLVRDSSGHTGWLLAGRLDVDVPEEVGGYAEGQRMVGAYPIAKVMDSGVEHEHKAGKKNSAVRNQKVVEKETASETGDAAAAPVSQEHTEYVTVLSPPRGGLPYDFDQLRVFTWSLNHHRYETAYRLRGIQGYLPVKLSQETVNGQSMPTFSFAIASGPNVSIDPETGVTRPVAPRTLAFRLEGNLVRRTGADQGPIVLTHDISSPEEQGKKKSATKKKKR